MKTFYHTDFTAEVQKGQHTKKECVNKRENMILQQKGKEKSGNIVGPCEHEGKWVTEDIS